MSKNNKQRRARHSSNRLEINIFVRLFFLSSQFKFFSMKSFEEFATGLNKIQNTIHRLFCLFVSNVIHLCLLKIDIFQFVCLFTIPLCMGARAFHKLSNRLAFLFFVGLNILLVSPNFSWRHESQKVNSFHRRCLSASI